MRLVCLNGVCLDAIGVDGRIGRWFSVPCIEPYRWQWRTWGLGLVEDLTFIMDSIPGEEPYLVCGLSDGATMAYHLTANDTRCCGCVAHSGMRARVLLRQVPYLFLWSPYDVTGCGRRTRDMYESSKGYLGSYAQVREVPRPNIWGHGFGTAVPIIQQWFRYTFGVSWENAFGAL